MISKLRPTLVLAATILGLTIATGAPATAATGGGCGAKETTDACISKSGNYVYADFYQNATPDSSSTKAVLTLYNKGAAVKSATYALNRTGRFGPISYNVATLPVTSGSAYSCVKVYTSTGALHRTSCSPTLYY
ncbi:hypothetical protein ACFY3O_35935 [Streptomyces sp. NPDC001046]|uniref:hypothetical protein n=1 Tax=unclassified Streptomyces TaxID=2593676 RepID=UPI0036A9959C